MAALGTSHLKLYKLLNRSTLKENCPAYIPFRVSFKTSSPLCPALWNCVMVHHLPAPDSTKVSWFPPPLTLSTQCVKFNSLGPTSQPKISFVSYLARCVFLELLFHKVNSAPLSSSFSLPLRFEYSQNLDPPAASV